MTLDCLQQIQHTRNGTPFRLYASDGLPPHVVHGAVFIDGGWLAYEWTAEGRVNDDGPEHDLDLTNLAGKGLAN